MVNPVLLPYDVKKFPAYLKGLVNDLARLRGDIGRLEALQAQVQAELIKARADAQSCERLIVRFDPRLPPDGVAPVRAWRGKYGPRGALKAAILAELKSAYPAELPTTLIAMAMAARFELDFVNGVDRERWVHNSLTRGLKQLVDQGSVARLHDPGIAMNSDGRWRWVDPEGTPGGAAEMAERAAEAGVEVDEEPDKRDIRNH